MPGSFPTTVLTPSSEATHDAMEAVDVENLQTFSNQQQVAKKTLRQCHLINQLDTLVYILIGYQLIKYCHSASMIPVIAHVGVQKLLCTESITKDMEMLSFISFLRDYRNSLMDNNDDPDTIIRGMIGKLCRIIYWKALIVIVYHVMFICYWVIPIAERGQLYELRNGTWWFVSFIGEQVPSDNFPELGIMSKITRLGIWGLVISDLMIFMIQLILFQAIFKQSTILPIGRQVDIPEIETLRRYNDTNGIYHDNHDPPFALLINIYQSLSLSAFILSSTL